MRAALLLRLAEAARRGGFLLLGGAGALVLLLATRASGSADARYALATDVAATVGYLAAVVYGAFPLATDRARRRGEIARASPCPSPFLALGSAAGAATVAFLSTAVLFAVAGLAVAATGGPLTRETTRIGDGGARWFPVPRIRVPAEATHLRFLIRADLASEARVGTPAAPTIAVDGTAHVVHPDRPVTLPIAGESVQLTNLTPEFRVRLELGEVRALGRERPFVANAILTSIAPALGAAAIAALAAAASAHLSAPVAAMLMALLLSLGAMKGFLTESLAHGGAARAAADGGGGAGEEEGEPTVRKAAATVVGALLEALPDLARLDASAEVSTGDWVGARRAPPALLLVSIALLLATAVGAPGVRR